MLPQAGAVPHRFQRARAHVVRGIRRGASDDL